MLPTEDFARLCTGIYRASTSYPSDTPLASDAGSPSADSRKEGKTIKPGTGEGRFERKSLRSSSRILETLLSSSSIIIGNDLLVVSRRKSSKATLLVATRLRLETELHAAGTVASQEPPRLPGIFGGERPLSFRHLELSTP
jgi:hypothetical protein